MLDVAVSWRRSAAALAVVGVALAAIVVMFRADGLDAIDATVPRATRWFVHQPTGQVVLADGYSGRALARLDASSGGGDVEVAQGASGVALVDRSAGTAREIDASRLRLGPPQPFGIATRPASVIGVGLAGLVGVDTDTADAVVIPPGGEPVLFDIGAVGSGESTHIAPDGSIWSIAAGRLFRATSTSEQVYASGIGDARLTLVGSRTLVLDPDRRRAQFDHGDWVDLPTPVDVTEVVLQEPSPSAECGWIAADDELWCVGRGGIEHRSTIDGLDIDGGDRFVIAGDAAAVVRVAPGDIVRFDWRAGRILAAEVADVPAGGDLGMAASVDLIWVDERDGEWIWAITPWGLSAIAKNDASTPLLGESGEVIEAGRSTAAGAVGEGEIETVREPDDNGIDDPPVAVDDAVTARTGTPVHVAVTANDYDPDGEAVVLVGVGTPTHGTAEIATGTTVTYVPDRGQVGFDRFEYTIADGNGSTATATVTVQLLRVDAPNQAPVGAPDSVDTGPDAPVLIDVLLNDVDPERDALRIDSVTPPDVGGVVTEIIGPSGLPALRYEPPSGASGTASFTYRPIDVLGAVGEPVSVTVAIAQPADDNRPPIAMPDSVRLRRGVAVTVPVLANDRDPDGDRLMLSMSSPVPPALRVVVQGNELVVTAQAGSADLLPFLYRVDDGHGNQVDGSVLVAVIEDAEPNRPPIANADASSAVAGSTQIIDVLANDSDPDGDPLILMDASGSEGDVGVQGDRIRYTAPPIGRSDDAVIDRFTYSISDGNGHLAYGEVTVRVMPEAIAAPPFAQDDAATTEVDVAVTLDVLRNDRDPSGDQPSIVGSPGCPGGGTATVTVDSKVTYTPPRGRSGVFSCTYEVTNTRGLRATATIVVNVRQPDVVNVPPVVTNENVTVVVDEVIEVDVLANDRDPDGGRAQLRVLSSTTPVLGTAVRTDSVIRYTAPSVPTAVAITYQVGDANGGVTAGQLVIRVREPDPEPPVAVDDRRTITGPATTTSVDVLVNDADPDGDGTSLRVVSVAPVSGVDASALASGQRTVTFNPARDYVGDMVATYTIQDADGLTATATVTLTVLEAPNRPPVPGDDAGEVVSGGTVTMPIAFNDVDLDGDPLTYSIVQGADPALGVARIADQSLVFDAVPGASGNATIVYRVSDGEATADATARITILPCGSAAPQAPNVTLRTGYQQPIAIDLRAYARNGEVVEVGPPLSAVAGVYTPQAGENGTISFNYVVRNSCRVRATGLVAIDVNQDPIAAPYAARFGHTVPVTIPVTNLATDTEPLRIVALEGAPGWVAVVDDGRALFVDPAGRFGEISMVAVVADPGGLQARVPITLTIDNAAPLAQPDHGVLAGGSVTIDLLANDADPDGDAIALREVPAAVPFTTGSGVITPLGGGRVRIDVPPDATGAAVFEYTIADVLGAVSAPASVTLRVNERPVAADMTVPLSPGATVAVAAAVSDPDPDAVLTLRLLDTNTSPFAVTIDGLQFTVVAPNEPRARQSVRYQVEDQYGAVSAPAWLHLETIESAATTTTIPAP